MGVQLLGPHAFLILKLMAMPAELLLEVERIHQQLQDQTYAKRNARDPWVRHWAFQCLVKAGLLVSRGKTYYSLTEKGYDISHNPGLLPWVSQHVQLSWWEQLQWKLTRLLA